MLILKLNDYFCDEHIYNKAKVKHIVFDLEATCWNGHAPVDLQEIIEIGAIMINAYGEAEKDFSRFVKPKLAPSLSMYCKELTSITQRQIDTAKDYDEVIDDFKSWINVEEDYTLCSWGKFDKRMLLENADLHDLDQEWIQPHIDMKRQYQRIHKLKKQIGLKWAVGREEFEFEGIPHRAISDAINTAKIFVRYIEDWQY